MSTDGLINKSRRTPWYRSVWFASAICVSLLFLFSLPSINERILVGDIGIASTLNELVGKSPVFDHLVLAFADRMADERMLVVLSVIAAIFILTSANRPTTARRASLVAYLVLIGVGGILVQEFVEETVRRRSPAYELKGFRDIDGFYDDRVEVLSRETFPSDDGFGYFLIGLTLLRMGIMHGLFFFGAGLVFPLARCIVGSQWMSDLYLGALPMAILVSAVAAETRLLNVRQWLYSQLLNLLDRSGYVLTRRLGLLKGLLPTKPNDIMAIHEAVKAYAKTEAPKFITEGGTGQIRLEMPLSGAGSLIWFFQKGDYKAILRAYPLQYAHKAELHRQAVRLLQHHNVNVPAILDYQLAPKQYPAVILLEQFIDGTAVGPLDMTEQNVVEMAKQFSRLHSVRSERWGRLGFERSESFYSVLIRHLRRDLNLVKQAGLLNDEMQERSIWEWLVESTGQLDQQTRSYSLTHNDAHSNNGLFTPSGEFFLIDLTRCHWQPAARELVQVYRRWIGGSSDLIRKFEEVYFGSMTSAEYELNRKSMPLFERLNLLDEVVKRTDRAERRSPQNLKLREQAWHSFVQAMETRTG